MTSEQLLELTANITSQYVTKNSIPPAVLPDLISIVSESISALSQPSAEAAPAPMPAVDPKKSVRPDYLISLEDGQRYKTLKRHLSMRGLSPNEYRAKWGLPGTYPMVAPNYSARRAELARAAGLGRKPEAKKPAPKKAARAKTKA
jgi:predicted transcriptional regulator